ncbi:MAG: CHAT domain-containing protein [Prosthecobacter sp.]
MARANLCQVLREAHSIGREFFVDATGPGLASMPPWLSILLNQSVEWQIEAPPQSMFPVDMLPLGWMSAEPKAFNEFLMEHDDLSTNELASMLPCWQWPVVRRFLEMEQPSNRPLSRKQKVRMAFVGDGAPGTVRDSLRKRMQQAHQELTRHQRVSIAYQIETPWPDDDPVDTEKLTCAFANHLVNPEFMPRGCHYPEDPAAVTHLFCHGRTNLDPAQASSAMVLNRGMHFELHIGQLKKTDGHHEITAKALREHLEMHLAASPALDVLRQRTLIFMNACAGGMQASLDDVAIASVFLSKGHPAVIATEATIDQGTARRISPEFYENFLQNVPAHVALWQAQRRMICEVSTKRKPFPAALLYTCYGSPECRLPPDQNEKNTPESTSPSTTLLSDLFFHSTDFMTKR